MLLYLSLIDDQEDKDKFEYLYTTFHVYMLNEANNLVNNNYDAEDIVHDTFIDLAKNIKLIRTNNKIETLNYLLCVTRGHAYNFCNREKHYHVSVEEVEENLPDTDWTQLENTILYKDIVKVINEMDHLYSDVLYLHYCVGLNCKQISQLLGRKHSAVRQQLKRGKLLLITKLKKDGYIND